MKTNKRKLACTLLALLCLTTNTTFAKNSDYWMGKGRIACSSDGNMHDNDDWTATMMTLMILAKAGVQNQTVLYTHSDHIWGSDKGDVAIMKGSAEGGAQRFGFNNCEVMAAVENPELAYNAMAKVIAASTAADPLFIIAGGPVHVIGEGLIRANETNPDALNYVTIVSHSYFNNNHADQYATKAPHGPETPHSGWTWDELKKLFGSKVNFNSISDQNGTGTGADVYKTKDKFSAKSWSNWAWMGSHVDPNVQWVYTRGKEIYNPDYSDAGMAYYLVADLDGVRGDEMGNPEKLRRWVGSEAIAVEVDKSKVSSVTLSPSSQRIEQVGESAQFTATISPSTAVEKTVSWQSSNSNVATVDGNGLVTAVAEGSATITVVSKDGGKSASALVIVGSKDILITNKAYYSFDTPESLKIPIPYDAATGTGARVVKESDGNNCLECNFAAAPAGVSRFPFEADATVAGVTFPVEKIHDGEGFYKVSARVKIDESAATVPTTIKVQLYDNRSTNWQEQKSVTMFLRLGTDWNKGEWYEVSTTEVNGLGIREDLPNATLKVEFCQESEAWAMPGATKLYIDDLDLSSTKDEAVGMELLQFSSFAATAVGNSIVVNCSQAEHITIYSLSGSVISNQWVEAGEQVVATHVASGIYLVNNLKVVVR